MSKLRLQLEKLGHFALAKAYSEDIAFVEARSARLEKECEELRSHLYIGEGRLAEIHAKYEATCTENAKLRDQLAQIKDLCVPP